MRRGSIIRLAAAATIFGGLAAVPAAATANAESPTATSSAIFLTFGEAKREIRIRLRRDARREGEYVTYLEVNRCRGYSARRVRCFFYVEDTSDINCQGRMQVLKFPRFYRTQGIGTRCF